MIAWAARIGISAGRLRLIENKPGAPEGIAGDNRALEFSGYSKALDMFEGEGPFVICNDTLLRVHWSQGWARLIALWLYENVGNTRVEIWGDIRQEEIVWEEKPAIYLASWLWVLPNRASLDAFKQLLDRVVNQPLGEPSAPYLDYYKNWLGKPWWAGGWYGSPNEAELSRKLKSIRMEHALSLEIHRHYPEAMFSLGWNYPYLYRAIRLVDRFLARYHAMKRAFFRL